MKTELSERAFGTPAYVLIRDRLRKGIISGELAAGERLLTAEIARRFGVSPMPVREALQQLQGEGLVNILPHRGVSVRSFDTHFVRNVYDLRGAIEVLLARLSMPNLTPEIITDLKNMNGHIGAAAKQWKIESFLSLNSEFHHRIYVHSDNPEALSIFGRYSELVAALRNRYGFRSQRLSQVIDEHNAIIEALNAHDEPLVEARVRVHYENAKEDLLLRMSETVTEGNDQ